MMTVLYSYNILKKSKWVYICNIQIKMIFLFCQKLL